MKNKRPFPLIGAICGSLIGVCAAIGWHDAQAATCQFHQGGFAEDVHKPARAPDFVPPERRRAP